MVVEIGERLFLEGLTNFGHSAKIGGMTRSAIVAILFVSTVFVTVGCTYATDGVRTPEELDFRIALGKWPLPPGEHVRVRAWITNNSDHPIRIPTELGHFVFFEALQPPDNKPVIGVGIAMPEERVESVVLPPGGFYGCIVEHIAPGTGFWELWLRFNVPKSKANPDLWTGELTSNRIFLMVDGAK